MGGQDGNAPSTVGEYRIVRRIGAGGMGVVHLALSPSGRRVALKVIRGEFADDSDYRLRFRHEIAAARQVSGAFTAPVVGADPDADPPWMATQYFEAPTLSERVRETGPLGADEVWRLGRGLAEALRDIHRAGLVHRDLKPSNVLLTEDGPRVIDFGIARVLSSEPLTRTGKILGTVSFMAPEQLNTPREVDAAADVFALGAVLVYAATGRGPFDGETDTPPVTVAMRIVHDDPCLTGLSPGLRTVVERCLRKDPARRPSPTELLHLLREEPEGTTEPEGDDREERTAPETDVTTRRHRLRGPFRLLASVACAVTVVAVPVIWANHSDRDDAKGAPSSPVTSHAPRKGPAVEPAAAPRPAGWALWEKKPAVSDPFMRRGLPTCGGAGDVLVCSEDGVTAERIDTSTGRVLWAARDDAESLPGTVLDFAGGTVLVESVEQSAVIGFDVKTGKQLWSVPTTGATRASVRGSSVIWLNAHADGSWIERRDARTGELLGRRSFPEDKWYDLYDGGNGVLHLLSGDTGEAFYESIAVLDPDTLRTTDVLATFDDDPGTPVAADDETVTLLLRGESLTRVAYTDGTVRRIPLKDAPPGPALVQGDSLYAVRTDGLLSAFDLRTGRATWSVQTGGEAPARPVLADGRLYSLAGDGRITCIDPATGNVVWRSAVRRDPNVGIDRYNTGAGPRPEPVVLDGVTYAGYTTGSVVAVAPPSDG
ncbi:protein kinase [Streptomyces cellulosae]